MSSGNGEQGFGVEEDMGYDVPFATYTWERWQEMQVRAFLGFARFPGLCALSAGDRAEAAATGALDCYAKRSRTVMNPRIHNGGLQQGEPLCCRPTHDQTQPGIGLRYERNRYVGVRGQPQPLR